MYEVSDNITVKMVEAENMEEAINIAEEMWREYDWGDKGALIPLRVRELNDRNKIVCSEHVDVYIAPNHARLISNAAGCGKVCGYNPNDHDWTREGEGGADDNPGVWFTGGTSMVFESHCRRCGLHRTEYFTGTQRSPSECNTVKYRMLNNLEMERHMINGTMQLGPPPLIPWFSLLEVLCANVNTYTAIQDILLTSVKKGFISLDEGKKIAHDNNVGVRWNV